MIDLKKIISHSKEYGFIFPSSEIYDGLSAIYDYGPFGVELKNNIKNFWWQSMVHENENIVGIDYIDALQLLKDAKGEVKTAIVMKKKNINYDDGIALLKKFNGKLKKALMD